MHSAPDLLALAPCHVECSSNRAARSLRERLYRAGARRQGWKVLVNGTGLDLQRAQVQVVDAREIVNA